MKYLVLLLALTACQENAKSIQQTDNSNFQVDLLFEHDGCKVYRFYDHRSVYYTDCSGSVQTTHTSGKTTVDDFTSNSGKPHCEYNH